MAKITLKGQEVQTIGNLPEVGSTPQNITLVDSDLSEKSFKDYPGKKLVLNIFPSVDTGTCAASVRAFNKEASSFPNTVVINISRDLPFALSRFCAAEGLENVENLSDFRGKLGEVYGVEIIDSSLKGLLSRAVVVLDENGKVLHSEQVAELADEPNYQTALSVL